MFNKVKISTIPLQNGDCGVEIVVTVGTEPPKKMKQKTQLYAETIEELAETWMEADERNYCNDEDEGFLYDNLD